MSNESKVIFRYNDPLHVRVDTGNYDYLKGLMEFLSEFASNYYFMPKFRNGSWDGKIKMFNKAKRTFAYGLLLDVIKYTIKDWPDTSYEIENDVKMLMTGVSTLPKWNLLYQPYDYQENCIRTALRTSKGIIRSATACHTKGDKVLMDNGLFKNIEDIKENEYVIGVDGKPKRVLRTWKGRDKLYEINPTNKRQKITVTGNHLLHLHFTNNGKRNSKQGKIDNITVENYLLTNKTYKHQSKLKYFDSEINLEQKPTDCKLSPYFIGLYLGDGSKSSCCMTNIDKECITAVYEEASRFNMIVKRKPKYSYKIIGSYRKRNIIFNELEKIGIIFKHTAGNPLKCEDRFIPRIVFHQDIEYRKEVLAGLIDSDGHLDSGTSYTFVLKSKQLVEDIATLSLSLGMVYTTGDKIVNGVTYYRVRIMGDIDKIPVRIKRKSLTKKTKKNSHLSGFKVTYKGIDNFYGLWVEDSLYITNGGMITHNSGKSLMISYIVKGLLEYRQVDNNIIIVPNLGLIEQFESDMVEYGIPGGLIGKVNSKKKQFDKPIVISTWQSLQRRTKEMLRYKSVIVDECHGCRAQILSKVLKSAINAKWRFGFTGTMPPSRLDELTVKSYLGPVIKEYSSKWLQEHGYIADCQINMVTVEYNEKIKGDYNTIKETCFNNRYRMGLLKHILNETDSSVLLLVDKVSKEGNVLKEVLKDSTELKNRNIEFISGKDDSQIREQWRKVTNEKSNVILIATYGIFQVGVNIKTLDTLVLASPSKSKIRILQSIGRTLRKDDGKMGATIWDIVDDTKYLRDHADIRFRHYMSEGFVVYETTLREGNNYDIELKEAE